MNQDKQNLGKKALSGMLWSSGGSFAFQFVRILTQIVLARLLWPEAFGLVALAMSFVSVANYLIENGLTLFLIRKRDLEDNDAYTLFLANSMFALSIIVILVFFSTWIANWLGEEEVKWLLIVSSSAIFFNALGSVHKALLTRNLSFKGQTIILLISAVLSGFIAVIAGYLDFGVWSIVIYNISFQLIQTFMIVYKYPISIKGKFKIGFLKEALIYSWKLMVSGLIHTIYENIFNLIMGGLYSTSVLGFYSNALKIRDGAAQTLTDSIHKVSFPVLSKLQDDRSQLVETTRRILKLSIFVIYPILFGLASTSESIVRVVFTEDWLGMIPILQVLAINGLLIPLHKINLNLLTVVGRTDLYLKLEVQKKIVAFLTIALGLYFKADITQLLWILFINAIIGYLLNVRYASALVDYGLKKQLKDILSISSISLGMGMVVWLVPILLSFSWFVLLIIQVTLGGITYVFLAYVFSRNEFSQVCSLILRFTVKKV